MQNASQNLISLFTFCLLVGVVLLTVTLISPPAPLPVDAPATEFSAGRDMQDLEVIAYFPCHPDFSPFTTYLSDIGIPPAGRRLFSTPAH